MAISYKRTIIQVPLEDVDLFQDYANKYALSFSSAIIMLAKKTIEYEQTLKLVPDMIKIMKQEEKQAKRKKAKKG